MSVRDGVDHISKLKPVPKGCLYNRSDNIVRYDYFHLEGIIETKYDFNNRKCFPYFKRLSNFDEFKEDIAFDHSMRGTLVMNLNSMPKKRI